MTSHIHSHPMILALDSHWEPHRWITTDNAMEYEAKDLVQSHIGTDVIVYHGGISNATGEQSTLKTSTIIVLKGAPRANKGHRISTLTNRSLFRRDMCICAYCQQEFDEHDLTRDHIIPRAQGGKDLWMNVVASCYGCNNAKGDRTPKEAGIQLAYVPYVPCKAEYMLLMNRRVLTDQMELLVSRIRNKDSRILKKAA